MGFFWSQPERKSCQWQYGLVISWLQPRLLVPIAKNFNSKTAKERTATGSREESQRSDAERNGKVDFCPNGVLTPVRSVS